eukprot:10136623-Karenia_brevis.AAC.1
MQAFLYGHLEEHLTPGDDNTWSMLCTKSMSYQGLQRIMPMILSRWFGRVQVRDSTGALGTNPPISHNFNHVLYMLPLSMRDKEATSSKRTNLIRLFWPEPGT